MLRIHQILSEQNKQFSNQNSKTIIDSVLITTEGKSFRIRCRWLNLGNANPCVLITLEDCQQSLKNIFSKEIIKYGFTSREAELWSLKRTNHSSKEIAAKLFISEKIVKKHLKNINIKRRQYHLINKLHFSIKIKNQELSQSENKVKVILDKYLIAN